MPALAKQSGKQEATPEEFRALSHPLRMRILRLCLHEAMTNKELAEALGKDPATTLHHVRLLVRTGFLAAEPIRTGSKGALEKPYRATGKSWVLKMSKPEEAAVSMMASLDAFRDEVAEAAAVDPAWMIEFSRLGLKLTPATQKRVASRIERLVQYLAALDDEPDGDHYGFFVGFHRRS